MTDVQAWILVVAVVVIALVHLWGAPRGPRG